MVYEITYIDRESSEMIEKHRAQWYSEVCVITNNGLEQGYDVLVEGLNERGQDIHKTV